MLDFGLQSSTDTSNSNRSIVSFAKWRLPIHDSEDDGEPPWLWPGETNYVGLNKWTEKVEAAKEKVLGGTPCWCDYFRQSCELPNAISVCLQVLVS